MDDCKPATDEALLPMQDSHWHGATAESILEIIPLRLVLCSGAWSAELRQPDMIMGRHSTADLRLHLPDVSRRHCRFIFRAGSWHVFDLQSMNGLYVNDERVEQAELHDGDRLRIGSYVFEIQLGESACGDSRPPKPLSLVRAIACEGSNADRGLTRQAS